jgi:predicted amidohydrolase
MNLTALQLKTAKNFAKNLHKLIKYIQKTDDDTLILAPELYLSGYAYDRLPEAVEIGKEAIKRLKKQSFNKTIAITLTTKKKENYYNTLHIFHNGKIIHKQSKHHLFVMNQERKHFTAGNEEDIKIIEIDGIKIAALICFELRYIRLWEKLRGADIILVPAMWGVLRKENFETLTKALAVANQCFVVASDSANENMAKSSAVISPFGDVTMDDNAKLISKKFDLKEIKKMRRYLNVGIK